MLFALDRVLDRDPFGDIHAARAARILAAPAPARSLFCMRSGLVDLDTMVDEGSWGIYKGPDMMYINNVSTTRTQRARGLAPGGVALCCRRAVGVAGARGRQGPK